MAEPEMTVELACEIVDAWGEPQFGLHVIARTLRQALAAEVERRRAAEAELLRLSALLDNRKQEAARLRADVEWLAEDRAAFAEKLRAAEALAERMWPIIQEVAEADILGSDWPPQMRCGIPITIVLISAAGALVRERDNG